MPELPPLSRRSVIGGLAATALPWRAAAAAAASGPIELIAGGYNREGGRGLLPLRYDPAQENWQTGTPVAEAPDASFALPGGRSGLLYAVEEGPAGMVSAFRHTGARWQRLSHIATRGADPCHLALDHTRSALAVANYSSGSIILWRLDPRTGLPIGAGDLRVHPGHGPNAKRQERSHAHMVLFTPDNRWLLAVDLGADTVFAYPFAADGARLGAAQVAFRANPGAGPRHMALHPRLPRAYLVNELANSVTMLRAEPGARFAELGSVSTLPAGFAGDNTAAEIVVNAAGTLLYVSNRGHDSIAVFAIGADGGLTLVQHIPSGGQGPRHLLLLENPGRLLVANEKTGRLTSFATTRTGPLMPASSVAVPGVTYSGVTG